MTCLAKNDTVYVCEKPRHEVCPAAWQEPRPALGPATAAVSACSNCSGPWGMQREGSISSESCLAGKGLANKCGVNQAHADLLIRDRSKKPAKRPETQK